MTNFEFFKEELAKMAEASSPIAINNGKPIKCCRDILCKDCDRHNNCNDSGLIKWLLSEHIEETENCKICKTLKVDDKILVSNTGDDWKRRYFAGYDSENDVVITYDSGKTSWSSDKTWVSHWRYVKLPEEEGEQE